MLTKWTRILDQHDKGYISRDDIYDAANACGIEATAVEMAKVTGAAGSARAAASLELFSSLGCSIETAEECVGHYRRTGFVVRPDNFVFWTERQYCLTRFFSLLVPGLSFFTLPHMLPRYTPYETTIFGLLNLINAWASVLDIVMVFQVIVVASGASKNVPVVEVLSIFASSVVVVWASQCSREAAITKDRFVDKERQNRAASVLRYTKLSLANGKTVTGIEALSYMARSCFGREDMADYMLKSSLELSSLSFFNSQNKNITPANRRRSSSAVDDLETLAAVRNSEVQHQIQNNRYNLFRNISKTAGSWVLGCVFAAVPTIFKIRQGLPNMFDADYTGWDKCADTLTAFFVLVSYAFMAFIMVTGDLGETDVINTWVDFLRGSISRGSDFRNEANDKLDFHLRLNSTGAVESFEALYSCLSANVYYECKYVKKTYEIMSIVCVASVAIVFVGLTLLDVDIQAWRVMLFLQGILTLVVMLVFFFRIVVMHSKLGKLMVILIRHQRRLNEVAVEEDECEDEKQVSEEQIRHFKAANKALDRFVERILDTHMPQKLLGILPMTHENMVKLGAAIGAALFTTVLRKALSQN
jgi:hypothetical protein